MTSPASVRRLTWLLFGFSSVASAAFITSSTISAIVGEALGGGAQWSGVPSTVYLLGSALAAYPAARLMERVGRRWGLSLGLLLGIGGAALAGVSVLYPSFLIFLIGFALMGATRGFTDLARYAAAEMHTAADRGWAISLVVLGGTVGAVLGPALVGPTGRVAEFLHGNALAGPWFATATMFGIAWFVIILFLRPDPSAIARELHTAAETVASGPVRHWREILRQPRTQLAVGASVFGQLVMVLVMSMTSLHMKHHGHALDDISIVYTAHTLGMYGVSLLTGRLVDKFGRAPLILAGALILIAACLLAPVSQSTFVLTIALFLLGLGWNFCYVAGGALLTDSLTLAERARWQGSIDMTSSAISALSTLGGGFVFASYGYTVVASLGLAASLIPLALSARHVMQFKPALETE